MRSASNRARRPDFSQAITVDLIDAYIAKSINSIKNCQNFNNNLGSSRLGVGKLTVKYA